MTLGLVVMLVAFVVLLLLNTPIAIVIGGVTLLAAWAMGYDAALVTVASDMVGGVDSFALLAIPFFILAGDLMGAGGLARRLIDLAASMVGRLPGGLAVINTITCMLFGAISGSAAAAVSSVGGTLIPEMNRQRYPKNFNVAVTTASATVGLLIPPSNVMIVYAIVAANVSVGALFLAGAVPGILVGLALIVVSVVVSLRQGLRGQSAADQPAFWRSVHRAAPSLLLVVVVIGGILGGVFTATEASAVAVLWAFLLGVVVYREIPLGNLPEILLRAARMTAVVLLLVGASRAMSQLLINEQVPQVVSAALVGMSSNPLVILLIINLLFLLVGTFMDITPAILIFTPILLPVTMDIRMDPIHFGIVMIANLCIGLCTPPVGTCLFVGCSVGKADIGGVSRAMLPFYVAMIVVLVLITYVPALSLWLPGVLMD